MTLLTIAEIANILNVSASTIKFYRDKYNKYLPCIGEGRSRRYEAEIIEGFKIIIESYQQKQPVSVIENRLQEHFGILQQTVEESKHQTAAVLDTPSQPSQPMVEQVLSLVMEHQKQLMSKMVSMEAQLEEQRIAQLHIDKVQEEERAERLKLNEKLDKQEEMLKKHYQLVDERLRSVTETKPKTFLQRLFG